MRLFADRRGIGAILLGLTCAARPCLAAGPNLLANPSLARTDPKTGLPADWSLYGRLDDKRRIRVVDLGPSAGQALLLHDDDQDAEIGITQAVPAQGGKGYEAAVETRMYQETPPLGAYLQLRFLPSNVLFQTHLGPRQKRGREQCREDKVQALAGQEFMKK